MADEAAGRDTDEVMRRTRGGLTMGVAAATMLAAEAIMLMAQEMRRANEKQERAAAEARARVEAARRADARMWRAAATDQWWDRANTDEKAAAWRAVQTWHQVDPEATRVRGVLADRLAAEGVDVSDPAARPGDIEWLRGALQLAEAESVTAPVPSEERPVQLSAGEQDLVRRSAVDKLSAAHTATLDAYTVAAAKDVRLDQVDRDKLRSAAELVVNSGNASTTMLRRSMNLPVLESHRVMAELERLGVVGPSDGTRRDVLVSKDQLDGVRERLQTEEATARQAEAAAAAAAAARDQELEQRLVRLDGARRRLEQGDDPYAIVAAYAANDGGALGAAMRDVQTEALARVEARDLLKSVAESGQDGQDTVRAAAAAVLAGRVEQVAQNMDNPAPAGYLDEVQRLHQVVRQSPDPLAALGAEVGHGHNIAGECLTETAERLRRDGYGRAAGTGREDGPAADRQRPGSQRAVGRAAMAEKVREAWPEVRAEAVIACEAWPRLADRLQRLEQEGHTVRDVLSSVRGQVEQADKPAALTVWHVKRYEERAPRDRRMRAVGKAYPGSTKDAVAASSSARRGSKTATAGRGRARGAQRERDL